MTYNMFGGTLSLTQSINQSDIYFENSCQHENQKQQCPTHHTERPRSVGSERPFRQVAPKYKHDILTSGTGRQARWQATAQTTISARNCSGGARHVVAVSRMRRPKIILARRERQHHPCFICALKLRRLPATWFSPGPH